ncbi:MAG: LysR family transcriptional regulator [Polyangiales bacterium]
MHNIDKTLDLNLLVVLEVLLQERSTTRAARRLNLTQSTVSHALARLRDQLRDELLVRHGRGLELTPRAERLADELPRALAVLGRALSAEQRFDPAHSTRVFALGAPDFAATLLPAVLERLNAAAPKASIELSVVADDLEQELLAGRIDLAIGSRKLGQDAGVRTLALADLQWVVFARRDHPCVKGWSRAAWERWPHVLVRRGHHVGPIELAARDAKLERRVGAYVSQFLQAAPLVAATDLLLTAPKLVFAALAQRFELTALEAPLALEPVHACLHWRAALTRDPELILLRESVQEAFARHVSLAEALPLVGLTKRSRR